jgi:hypothetical protein
LPPVDDEAPAPVLLLCANTEPATNREPANAATIATIAIKFNFEVDIVLYVNNNVYNI